ncbi:hypothetical protein L228DRAFT_118679 [Xylona heveae TC161]|uniref:Secreted protein n=1 Tax=Xylona heveae (strain CBS 132557 / TC161) TaxID=1328760 RepID=A0A165HHY5_XYLHT|nr:hypothetical protein L228DRAFT_118679 [Xylona heveae TC161]KZF23548.1 hypothetical protein L228DRAFT_118679 [Xylona heveae TC161]
MLWILYSLLSIGNTLSASNFNALLGHLFFSQKSSPLSAAARRLQKKKWRIWRSTIVWYSRRMPSSPLPYG